MHIVSSKSEADTFSLFHTHLAFSHTTTHLQVFVDTQGSFVDEYGSFALTHGSFSNIEYNRAPSDTCLTHDACTQVGVNKPTET